MSRRSLLRKRASGAWNDLASHQRVGLIIFTGLLVLGFLAPWTAPFDPMARGTPYQSPSADHALGTDELGRDNLSRLLYGITSTLEVATLAALVSLLIGVSVGIYAGYYRGRVEGFLMGTTDVFLLLPALPLMILLASYMTPSEWNIVLVFSLLWWCPTARIVHAKTLQIRDQPYVRSSLALGYRGQHVIWHHVLPNCTHVIAVKFTMGIAQAMLVEASLSFLGLGDPYSVTWGGMVNDAYMNGAFANDLWWWYLPPCLMIALTASSFTMIGSFKERGRAWQI